MIRTLVKFILITALLAKKYLIEVGDKAGDKGDVVDQGEGDYSSSANIEMKEYGQFNIIKELIYFLNLIFKTCQSFKEETEEEVEGEDEEDQP